MKKIYLIIVLKEQNGEYQYSLRTIETLEVDTTKDIKTQINEFGEDLARNWYDNFSYVDDEHYYFNGGCVCVTYKSFQEIKEKTYNEIRNIMTT